MTTLAQSFGTSSSFTLNSTSWAQAVTISSDAVNVAGIATIPDDIQITVKVTFPNATIGAQNAVNVYVSCSEDGTTYDENDQYSGTNNSHTTLRLPSNYKGPVVLTATANVVTALTFSLLSLGLGSMPRKFGIILENQCSQTIATVSATYTPINYTNA
ncbi:MAG: hypothetical protein KGJ13_08645 [Patescibacteria group bacterium]|nr:hypothetical protein [Patescibacteria group bacterium]